MLFDMRFSWLVFILLVLCVIFPFLGNVYFVLLGETETRLVENTQAIMLFSFALFSYFYMQPLQLPKRQKRFWLWAVCWWVVLFGRSTSWGRDYFPEIPKIYFRMISIVLIASITLPLFDLDLRQEIIHKIKANFFPTWGFIITLVGLIISDSIEHDRFLSSFFLDIHTNKDFLEELYEYPLIMGLFIMNYSFMKNDKILNLSQ